MLNARGSKLYKAYEFMFSFVTVVSFDVRVYEVTLHVQVGLLTRQQKSTCAFFYWFMCGLIYCKQFKA